MHPAFSVILFTTLSGSGFGLLALLGLHRVLGPLPFTPGGAWAVFGFGAALAVAGLVASLWHLGKPARAWRAFSQWRTAWLSREGVAAVATLGVALVAVWTQDRSGVLAPILGALLCAGSLATLGCTAMIYVSLPPIAAWRDRAVLPGYLAFGLFGGALWLQAALALGGLPPAPAAVATLALLALALAVLKTGYWRRIDALALPSAAAAVGLPAIGTVRTFERPHTQGNYLLHEMGFVLARRHARRLRRLALVLGLLLPLALLLSAWLAPGLGGVFAVSAAVLFQLGALVERWLFFAQARHTIQVYYGVAAAA